jgi:putative transposase
MTFKVMTGALEHYMASEKIWSSLFLAMPDHLHALLSFPPQIPMEKIIRDWKRFVAKQAAVKWQDGFFDHRLRSNESFAEKADYIRQNPVRAGLVSASHLWNYVWPDCNVAPAR